MQTVNVYNIEIVFMIVFWKSQNTIYLQFLRMTHAGKNNLLVFYIIILIWFWAKTQTKKQRWRENDLIINAINHLVKKCY